MAASCTAVPVSGLSPLDLVSVLSARDRRPPRPALGYLATDIRDAKLDPAITSTREKLKAAIRS